MYWVNILAGVIGTIGFAIIFKVNPKLIPFVALDGLVACGVYFLFLKILGGVLLPNALAAFATAAVADVCAKYRKAPSTVFLLPGCITLVPGGPLYYSMSHLIEHDYVVCFQYLIVTLKVGLGIAGGIIAASLLRYIVNFVTAQMRRQKE